MTHQTEQGQVRARELANMLIATLDHYGLEVMLDPPQGEGLIYTLDVGHVVVEVTPDEIHVSTGGELAHVEVYRSIGVCARRIAWLKVNRADTNLPLGAKLRILREGRGWSQEKSAALSGVTQAKISKTELGYRSDYSIVDVSLNHLAPLGYRIEIRAVGRGEVRIYPEDDLLSDKDDDVLPIMDAALNQYALNRAIGSALKTLRDDQQLTGKALAEALGVKQPFISKLETGKADWHFNQLRFYLQRFGFGVNLVAASEKGIDGHVLWDECLLDEAPFAWLVELYALVERGKIESASDLLADRINDLLFDGEFAKCDALLHEINVENLDTHLSVVLLSVTFPVRDKLYARPKLWERVETRLTTLTPNRVEKLISNLR